MIAAVMLAVLLGTASPPIDDATLDHRMMAGRIGAVIAFVGLVAGLAYGARVLARRAKQAEDRERLAEAFHELEEELGERSEQPHEAKNDREAGG